VEPIGSSGVDSERLRPWDRPTPVIIQRRARARERALAMASVVRVVVLLATDLLLLFVGHASVNLARGGDELARLSFTSPGFVPRGTFPRIEVITAIILGLAIFGNYRSGPRWRNVTTLLAGSSLGLSLVFWSRLWNGASVETIIAFLLLLGIVAAVLSAGRHVLYHAVQKISPSPIGVSRAIVLGSRASADQIAKSEAVSMNQRIAVVGKVITDSPLPKDCLGGLSDLVWILERHSIDSILIADQLHEDVLLDVLEVAEKTGCTAVIANPVFPFAGFVPTVIKRGHIPFVRLTRPSLRIPQLISKRAFDIVSASALLVLLAPLFIVIAIAIRVTSRGPVFYKHVRVGYAGKRFQMYKFRSMVRDAEKLRADLAERSIYTDQRVFKIPDDPRITSLGRFLRRSSLDELPQLLNVLEGDMSMVGPRPPLASEVELYEEHNYTRFDMKPGITGPWQVAGRNVVTNFDELIAMETEYLTDWSLLKDFSILLKTVPAVLSMKGAV